MKRILLILAALLLSLGVQAQADRHDVRAGNAKFRRGKFKESEIDYRKAALKDSLSVAAQYNLASSLYRQEDYAGAGASLDKVKEVAPAGPHAAQYAYNRGDVALQQQDYAAAVEAFRDALLLTPGDLDAKEKDTQDKVNREKAALLKSRQKEKNW